MAGATLHDAARRFRRGRQHLLAVRLRVVPVAVGRLAPSKLSSTALVPRSLVPVSSLAAATRRLQEAGRNSRDQRQIIDQAAAVQILQDWLDGNQGY